MNLWNQKCLPAPPTNTYISRSTDLDVIKFKNSLQDCIKHFKNEDFMIREAALLSRILYRMKMKFRSSKEFKSLEKINHSLNIYLGANMARDLKNVFDLVPSKYQSTTYLPTRNMLSYILVRFQGLVKLMERVYDTCQVAAYEINTRISIGHFWKIYVVLFALVSRLYILVKFNTKHLCELYGKLLPHLSKLENSGKAWLPEGYVLPNDLREWLGVNWVYEEEFIDLTCDLSLNTSAKIIDFFNLVDDDDDEVQFCDEYVLVDREDQNITRDFRKLKPVKETFTRNRMRGFSINEDDIGEDIAEIIKLEDTIMENNNLDNKKMDEDGHLNGPNKIFDIDDFGEEIELQILNLDESNKNDVRVDKYTDHIKVNNDLVLSPIKETPKKSKKQKRKRKNKNNATIINLADDSVYIKDTEVVEIPETPAKKIRENLEDNSVMILDNTFAHNSEHSKTLNNLGLNILNSGVKKKKGKSKGIKKVVDKNTSLTDANTLSLNDFIHLTAQSLKNKVRKTEDKTLEEKVDKANILSLTNKVDDYDENWHRKSTKLPQKCQNNSNNLSPLKKKELKSEEKTKKRKRTAGENDNSNLTNESIKIEEERQQENEEIKSIRDNTSLNESKVSLPQQLSGKRKIDEHYNLAEKASAKKKRQQENEEISPIRESDTVSLKESSFLMPQKLEKTEIRTEAETLAQSNDKRNDGENCSFSYGKRKWEKKKMEVKNEKKRQWEKKKMEDKNEVETKNKKKKKDESQIRNEIDPKEYARFNSVLDHLNKFLTNDPEELERNQPDFFHKRKEERRDKNKIERNEIASNDSLKSPEYQKRNTNVLRLNLVKEIPSKNCSNQEKDDTGVCATEAKSVTKMKLVPRLETPLKARLNIETLINTSSRMASPEQNIPSTSSEKPEKKKNTRKLEKEQSRMASPEQNFPSTSSEKPEKKNTRKLEKEQSTIIKESKIEEVRVNKLEEKNDENNLGKSPFVFQRNLEVNKARRLPKKRHRREKRYRTPRSEKRYQEPESNSFRNTGSKFFRNTEELYR